jgi:hypothetical protein
MVNSGVWMLHYSTTVLHAHLVWQCLYQMNAMIEVVQQQRISFLGTGAKTWGPVTCGL